MNDHPPPRRRRIIAVATAAGVLGLTVGGCETLKSGGQLAPAASDATALAATQAVPRRPSQHWLRVSQYVFHSDSQLDANNPLFQELEDLPEQIQTELMLPPGETLVQVFLFDSQERYEAYMQARYPRLPLRRAYFIAEPRAGGGDDLLVFTWLGENLRTDLRHELTHATLHGVLKGVPLWLDEGLASFFELPPSTDGVNVGHLDALRRGPFLPDLARLEKLGQVRQMEKPEYREAWAWVHLMLRGRPEARQVLLDYVQQLRTTPNPGPLLPKLKDALIDPNQALADHLARADVIPVTARGRR
jgi:hypothetical protein